MPDSTKPIWGRRAALLGGAALLAGCSGTRDWLDDFLSTRKVPLEGERRAVLTGEREITPDEAALSRPFSLPPPTLNTEWPTAGGAPNHAPGHLALSPTISEAWRSSVGSGNDYRRRLTASPLVVGDSIFAADALGWVTCLDTARGRRRWRADTRPRRDRDGALGGAIAFADDTLYVATGLAEVMALDPGTGEIKWRASIGAAARGGLSVAGNKLLVPTVENHLLGLSREDGSQSWRFRASPVQALPLGLPSPAVEGDVAVAGFASGEIVALNVADGRVLWSDSLGTAQGGVSIADIGAISALPVIDRGRVFAIGMAGAATSLDLRSGRRVWEREVGGSLTPVVVGDWFFALARGNRLMALERDSGRVRWIISLPGYEDENRRRNPIVWGPPALAGGRLLVTSSNRQLLEVDAGTGEIARRQRLSEGATAQPVIAGNSAFLLTDDGSILALRGTE
jgi:outer membrane protein assembly factor BamB